MDAQGRPQGEVMSGPVQEYWVRAIFSLYCHPGGGGGAGFTVRSMGRPVSGEWF